MWTSYVVPVEIDFFGKRKFLKILSGFTSDLAKISGDTSGDPPRRVSGGSPDNFRRDNIAGSHGSFKICETH